MMTCIIIEDQPHAQGILEKYISDVHMLQLLKTFGDAVEAHSYLIANSVDLIFLDIHLPKLSGIDLLSLLNPRPKIVFTTAFSEYAIQGYELDVVDYLLKPFSFARFLQAVAKAERSLVLKRVNAKQENVLYDFPQDDIIFIKSGSDFLRVIKSDIEYIKAHGDYSRVFTSNSKFLASHSLKYWLQQLPDHYFCQIHKSFIINVRAIHRVSSNQIYIGNEKLPIGRTFRARFFANYLDDIQGN